jgi:hypothetical protein
MTLSKRMILLYTIILCAFSWSYAQTTNKDKQGLKIGGFTVMTKGGRLNSVYHEKNRTLDIDMVGNPVSIISPQIDLQGKKLVAQAIAPKGESNYLKSAIIENKVRIVTRQEDNKHIVTCDKAILESSSSKGKKTIQLIGNVRDEYIGVFGDAVTTANTGRIEWMEPIISVTLDDVLTEGNTAPKSIPKPKSSINPPKKDNK